MLEKEIVAAAHAPSYATGQQLLDQLAGISVSARGLNKQAVKIGNELVIDRDARTEAYFHQPLPRTHTTPDTPIPLASVSADGGRMQTRLAGAGMGVHDPHWRETKNGLFQRMSGVAFDHDPHPELPRCFASPEHLKTLVGGVNADDAEVVDRSISSTSSEQNDDNWRPQPLFRTCLSSLCNSDAFGRMMEAEVDARGFFHARKKAFLGDGLPYNWTIQQRHFPDFTPILDFTHAIERLYEAARPLHDDQAQVWERYLSWARSCWQGNIQAVLAEMRGHQQRLGFPPKDCEQTDPRKVLAEAIGYFENNAARMDYPRYRREGLPTTSAHLESFVKEMNARVKGTEKFWDDGPSAEAILQIRAAALSEDNRLTNHLRNRPGHPFHTNVPRVTAPATSG